MNPDFTIDPPFPFWARMQMHHMAAHDHGHEHDRRGGDARRGRGGPRGRGRGRGGWDGDPGFGFFGRGPRAARGDVRAAILALLTEQPMHGYQVIQELAARSQGVWKPSPGSVYPTLQQLEDEGLVRPQESDGRKVFVLTEAGQAEANARGEGRPAPWEEVSGDVDAAAVDLRDLVMQVANAVRQVVHHGSPTQVKAARELLGQTRKSLYRILSEDDS